MRLIRTQKNFELIIKALYCLDSMISNGFVDDNLWAKIKTKHVNILKHLTQNKSRNKYDNYVYDTFDCFIRNKHFIHIRVNIIAKSSVNKQMRELIMNPIDSWKDANYAKGVKIAPRRRKERANLFKRKLFDIFKFAKKVMLQTCYEDYLWKISLWSVLDIIKRCSLDEIILELGLQKDYKKLLKIYPISKELIKKYKEANYDISKKLIQNTGFEHGRVWCIISRKG